MTTPPQDQPQNVQPYDPTGSTEGAYPVENPNPPLPEPEQPEPPAPKVGTTQDDVIQGDAAERRRGA